MPYTTTCRSRAGVGLVSESCRHSGSSTMTSSESHRCCTCAVHDDVSESCRCWTCVGVVSACGFVDDDVVGVASVLHMCRTRRCIGVVSVLDVGPTTTKLGSGACHNTFVTSCSVQCTLSQSIALTRNSNTIQYAYVRAGRKALSNITLRIYMYSIGY